MLYTFVQFLQLYKSINGDIHANQFTGLVPSHARWHAHTHTPTRNEIFLTDPWSIFRCIHPVLVKLCDVWMFKFDQIVKNLLDLLLPKAYVPQTQRLTENSKTLALSHYSPQWTFIHSNCIFKVSVFIRIKMILYATATSFFSSRVLEEVNKWNASHGRHFPFLLETTLDLSVPSS